MAACEVRGGEGWVEGGEACQEGGLDVVEGGHGGWVFGVLEGCWSIEVLFVSDFMLVVYGTGGVVSWGRSG